MNNDKMRTSFEEWYEGYCFPLESDWFKKHSDGEYAYAETAVTWDAWQAAQASIATPLKVRSALETLKEARELLYTVSGSAFLAGEKSARKDAGLIYSRVCEANNLLLSAYDEFEALIEPLSAADSVSTPPDLANQIANLKQRIAREASFSHLEMVHVVLPIIRNLELALGANRE